MTQEVIYIDDPLGRKICIEKNLCAGAIEEIEANDLFDDFMSVIKKPAILIQTTDTPSEYLYFRTLGWYFSVLLKVKSTNGFWKAYKCTINPSDADIVELLKTGKQII